MQRDEAVALFWELVRFGWVGVFTVCVYAGEMWLLRHHTSLPAWACAIIATLPCLLLNYTLHRSFTFKSDKHHGQAGPRYLAIQLSGMAFNSSALWLTVERLRWPFLPAQVVVIVLLAGGSYIGQKLWSFD